MFLRNIKKLFLSIITIASLLLVYLWYSDYSFKKNPLNEKYLQKIEKKHLELRFLAKKHFNITRVFPIIVSDKISSKKFGMTSIDNRGRILIYLNKKRFKENDKYMIEDVFPHEYAHALMFTMGNFSSQNSGHSKKWEYICKKLEGARCDRFVNNNDIIIEKTDFFK